VRTTDGQEDADIDLDVIRQRRVEEMIKRQKRLAE
jgi:hypothetical protein